MNNRKISFNIVAQCIPVLAIIVPILLPLLAHATVETYTLELLNPITELFGNSVATPDIPTIFRNAFRITIGVASAVAVIMLTVAGFEYIVAESFGAKGEAKKRIWGAVYGVGLLIGSYILLMTINPRILQFQFAPAPTSPTPVNIAGLPHKFTYKHINGAEGEAGGASKALCDAQKEAFQSQRDTSGIPTECTPKPTNQNLGDVVYTSEFRRWTVPRQERTGSLDADAPIDYMPVSADQNQCTARALLIYNQNTPQDSYSSSPCTKRSDTPLVYRYNYTWRGMGYTSALYTSQASCESSREDDTESERPYHSVSLSCLEKSLEEAMDEGMINTVYCLETVPLPKKQSGCFTNNADCEDAREEGFPLYYDVSACTPVNPS